MKASNNCLWMKATETRMEEVHVFNEKGNTHRRGFESSLLSRIQTLKSQKTRRRMKQ